MAYQGSTAASSVANPPRRLVGGMVTEHGSTVLVGNASTAHVAQGARGGTVWAYVSTDEVSTVTGAGYFTDGSVLGMRPGDFVIGAYHSTAGSSVEVYLGVITAVAASSAATLRAGTLASSA